LQIIVLFRLLGQACVTQTFNTWHMQTRNVHPE
jgi:hypothetical protein